eukprot:g16456.t1
MSGLGGKDSKSTDISRTDKTKRLFGPLRPRLANLKRNMYNKTRNGWQSLGTSTTKKPVYAGFLVILHHKSSSQEVKKCKKTQKKKMSSVQNILSFFRAAISQVQSGHGERPRSTSEPGRGRVCFSYRDHGFCKLEEKCRFVSTHRFAKLCLNGDQCNRRMTDCTFRHPEGEKEEKVERQPAATRPRQPAGETARDVGGVCFSYRDNGTCNYGDNCHFSHRVAKTSCRFVDQCSRRMTDCIIRHAEVEKPREKLGQQPAATRPPPAAETARGVGGVCFSYRDSGTCKRGDKCDFASSHRVAKTPCRYGDQCTRRMTDCTFRHAETAKTQAPPPSTRQPKGSRGTIHYVTSKRVESPAPARCREKLFFMDRVYRFEGNLVTCSRGDKAAAVITVPAPALFVSKLGTVFYEPGLKLPVKEGLCWTHDRDLQLLPKPLPLSLPDASHYELRGEWVMFFVPYDGEHAKGLYQQLRLYRFNADKLQWEHHSSWTLRDHYLNAAVVSGRFLLLSWWPYQDEVWRALHEQSRTVLQNLRQLEERDASIRLLGQENIELQRQLGEQKLQAERKRQEHMAELAREQQRHEQERRRWEAERRQRLMWQDPIHLYVLNRTTDRFVQVLDYHKGADSLDLLSWGAEEEGSEGNMYITAQGYELEFGSRRHPAGPPLKA